MAVLHIIQRSACPAFAMAIQVCALQLTDIPFTTSLQLLKMVSLMCNLWF